MPHKNKRQSLDPRASWNEIVKKAAEEPGVPEILKLLESQQRMPDAVDRSTVSYPELPVSRTSTVC